MMTGKQALIDMLVVLVAPLLLIGGYYYFKSGDDALLSLGSGVATPGRDGGELGEKTTLALAMLKSIDFDVSLFQDPAYLSLQDFSVTVASTTLGRPYPFTSPPEIRELLRRSLIGQSSGQVISPSEKLDILGQKYR